MNQTIHSFSRKHKYYLQYFQDEFYSTCLRSCAGFKQHHISWCWSPLTLRGESRIKFSVILSILILLAGRTEQLIKLRV